MPSMDPKYFSPDSQHMSSKLHSGHSSVQHLDLDDSTVHVTDDHPPKTIRNEEDPQGTALLYFAVAQLGLLHSVHPTIVSPHTSVAFYLLSQINTFNNKQQRLNQPQQTYLDWSLRIDVRKNHERTIQTKPIAIFDDPTDLNSKPS